MPKEIERTFYPIERLEVGDLRNFSINSSEKSSVTKQDNFSSAILQNKL